MVEIRTLIARLRGITEADKRMASNMVDIVKDVEGDRHYAKKGKQFLVDRTGMTVFPDYMMIPVLMYMDKHPRKARKIAIGMKEFVNKSIAPSQKKSLKKWLGIKRLPEGLPVDRAVSGVGIFARAYKAYENVHGDLEKLVDPKKQEAQNREKRMRRLQKIGVGQIPKKFAEQVGPVLLYIATTKNRRNEAKRYAQNAKNFVHRSVKPSEHGGFKIKLPTDLAMVVELFARAFYDAEL